MSDHFDRKRKSVLEYGGRLLPTFLVLNSVIRFGEKLRSVSRFVSSVSRFGQIPPLWQKN